MHLHTATKQGIRFVACASNFDSKFPKFIVVTMFSNVAIQFLMSHYLMFTPSFSKSNHKVSKHIQLPNLKEKFIHYLKIRLWDLGHCWAVILVAQTLPVIYDQYEDAIDHSLENSCWWGPWTLQDNGCNILEQNSQGSSFEREGDDVIRRNTV